MFPVFSERHPEKMDSIACAPDVGIYWVPLYLTALFTTYFTPSDFVTKSYGESWDSSCEKS